MKIKFSKLRENQVYTVIREDGLSIAVTKNPEMLIRIISDEFSQARVTIDQIVYNKQDYSYRVVASVYEENEDGNKHGFQVIPTTFYQPGTSLVCDKIEVCDVHKDNVSDQIKKEIEGQHSFEDTHTLAEHIYSLDLPDGDIVQASEELREFIQQLKKEAPEACYFRLI